MSEFSESYHLWSSSPEAAVKLLQDAGLTGYVFPSTGKWTTLVVGGSEFTANPSLVQHNPGILLHYTHAEDHGWSFSLFDKGKKILSYTCEWDDEVKIDDTLCTQESFSKAVDDYGIGDADDLWALLHPESIDETLEAEAATAFAETMGLEHYEWFSFDYVDGDFEDSPEDFEGVQKVG